MPTLTKISPQKRAENRRNIYLDGKFAFGCNLNVVAKFRLREGMVVDDAKIREIEGDRDKNRFNKGRTGRGAELLSDGDRERIRHLAVYFPKADFGLLGI